MARPFLGYWLGVCAVLSVLSPGVAHAQATISLGTSGIVFHRQTDRTEFRTYLSRQDCIEDIEISFPLRLGGDYRKYSLEVWAGIGASAKCTQEVERTGNNKHCWQIWGGTPTGTATLKLRASDILNSNSTCDKISSDSSSSTDSAQDISVYFMLITAAEPEAESRHAVWTSKFDLVGPDAPEEVTSGVGEERLFVKWKAQTGDISGYRVYCEKVEGSRDALHSVRVAADASGGSGGSGGAGGSSGSAGSGGTSGSGGLAGEGGSGGTGDEGTSNSECLTPLLRGGVAPHPDLEPCGSTDGGTATRITAENLENGTTYALAVAAVDQVGNSGVLSAVVCGEPQPIDDFFEVYRRAGGKGGGGFCALASEPSAPSLGALLFIGLVVTCSRRRRTC